MLNIHCKDWCWSWNSNILVTLYEELTHWKRSWYWERLKAEGEGDDRGWDGWMASPTWWTWVWANSVNWWWTGKPGVLQTMGLQRVRHDLWLNWQNWYKYIVYMCIYIIYMFIYTYICMHMYICSFVHWWFSLIPYLCYCKYIF